MTRVKWHSGLFAATAVVSLFSAITAQAATFAWEFTLAPEVTGAAGTGSATASFNDANHQFSYNVTFSGLSGTSAVAHFHCCTANPGTGTASVAVDSPSLLNFPVGVTFGSFSGLYDLNDPSSFNGTFFTNSGGTAVVARTAFLAGLNAGTAYLNIHSSTFPGGEIRGFAEVPGVAEVPEPGTLALLGLGLLGLGVSRRRKA